MKIVVTGGIGSGKSEVTHKLAAKLGYQSLSIDQMVAELYQDPQVIQLLQDQLGLTGKKELSDLAFSNHQARETIEHIFATKVSIKLAEELRANENLVIEFPLLFEKGKSLLSKFDLVVAVSATPEVRINRVLQRDAVKGMTRTKVISIMNLQLSDSNRELASDYVVKNNTTVEDLDQQVDQLVSMIQGKSHTSAAKTKLALVSGSFDPITLGHVWIIKKALSIVETVIVAIGTNPAKRPFFTHEEREELIYQTLEEHFDDQDRERIIIQDIPSDVLLVDYAVSCQANFIIRGIRNFTDFEYEQQLNLVQKKLAPAVETLYLLPPGDITEISSSLVKSVINLQNWERIARPYVSTAVFEELKKKAQK